MKSSLFTLSLILQVNKNMTLKQVLTAWGFQHTVWCKHKGRRGREEEIMSEDNTTNHAIQDYNITLYTIGAILFVVDLTASILFSIVIIKKALHQKKIYISLLSWVGAEILFGILLSIQISIAHMDWTMDDKPGLCLFWNGMQVYPLWVCNLHAVICAIDRYVIVLYPNKYELKLSKSKLKLYIGCSWVYGVLWTAIAYAWYGKESEGQLCNLCSLNHIYVFLLVMLHFIPTTIACVFLYAKVFMHFRRHERQVHVTHTLTQDELVDNTQLAKIILWITVFYAIAWLPFCLIGLVRASNLPLNSKWHTALLYAYLVGLSGCLFKLPLFTIFDEEFRSTLKNLLGLKKKPLQFGSSLQD